MGAISGQVSDTFYSKTKGRSLEALHTSVICYRISIPHPYSVTQALLRGFHSYVEHKTELDALAEKVIYTGAVDKLLGYCFGKLEYRSLRFETETSARSAPLLFGIVLDEFAVYIFSDHANRLFFEIIL